MRVPSDAPVQSFVARKTLIDKLSSRNAAGLPASQAPSAAGADDAKRQPVSISGGALLKQRLSDVLSSGPARPGVTQAGRHALTAADQQLLSDVYVWASEQGADLKHVDTLGRELAKYRVDLQNANRGKSERPSDAAQAPVARAASAENATIKRLLDSGALAGTRLDPGFIRHMGERSRSGGSSLQLEFMEKVVNRFSVDGGRAQTLGAVFAAEGKPASGVGATEPVNEGASRKPMTLESLRFARMGAAMKALGVRSLSGLWDSLVGRGRFRP